MAKRGRKKKNAGIVDETRGNPGVLDKILEDDNSEVSMAKEKETAPEPEMKKENIVEPELAPATQKRKKFKVTLRPSHPQGEFKVRYGNEWVFKRNKDGDAWEPIFVDKIPDDGWWTGGAGERWFKVEEV
jgi:hypothetical protein